MKNFLIGYPGMESGMRAAMREVMGEEKYNFFYDRWLYHFWTEEDAKLFQHLGLNCLRLPFNHRHLADDVDPRILKEEGFKHLDRVIKICARHGIYTILDMHTVPGGQNQDLHCDNPTNYAAFWDYKDYQDRTIWLWE
jgi:aryl-phospho-beta-D-glucosidase BglC (GH1 family)